MLGIPDGLDDHIGVFPGYLGAELVDFADAVAASLATADKNAVAVVVADTGQSAQVSRIGINRETAGDDGHTTPTLGPAVHSGELIGNSAATLSETNYNQFHPAPPDLLFFSNPA